MNVESTPDRVGLVAAAATAGSTVRSVIGFGFGVARSLPGVDSALAALEERGTEALRAADELTDRVLRAVIRRVVQITLLEVDITALVREYVDLDTLAEGIDIERIIDRVDVDAIAARVAIAPILDRVDVNAVAARVDVDTIAERVDVDSVISRVDLVDLANTVIEGVDLPRIIRESTGSMSAEAVRGVRTQGMQADDAVAGFIGKLLGRSRGETSEA